MYFCVMTSCVRSLEDIIGSIAYLLTYVFCIWVPDKFQIDDSTHYGSWRGYPFRNQALKAVQLWFTLIRFWWECGPTVICWDVWYN